MPKQSAGLLLYRHRHGTTEVLLVHPGGPFWQHRDAHAWSVPKGEVDSGEDLLAAARREFYEETGLAPDLRDPIRLTPCRQRSGKVVHAWAVEGDCDPAALRSNCFTMEWPPRSGQSCAFPEVDRAAWFSLGEARGKLHRDQVALVDELGQALSGEPRD